MQAQANLRVARYQSMGNLLFWLGIGAAQKSAGSKPIKRRHWVASLIVGILVALLIAVGMFFLLVSQK
jgi:ATP/ADP translocase